MAAPHVPHTGQHLTMHRTIHVLLIVALLAPVGVASVAAQSGATDGQIHSITYAGSGNVSLSGTDIALWQSSSHQFSVTVSSNSGGDVSLCLDSTPAGATTAQQVTCAQSSIAAGATETKTVSVTNWPKDMTGPQTLTAVLRSADGTELDNTTVSVTVLEKSGDLDGDGLTNEKEASLGTDLRSADTDGDGLTDQMEVDTYGSDPLKADTDGDGFTDEAEVNSYGTDPTKKDTDGDGLSDAKEVSLGTNPNKKDTDGDNLEDGPEVNVHETDPTIADTDGDGLGDGTEVNEVGTNPLKVDTDGDGLTDNVEVNTYETDPTLIDTDGDGLSDAAELNTYETDPTKADTDGDGLQDGPEVNSYGTSPTKVDTNGDGKSDYVEVKGRWFGFDSLTAGFVGIAVALAVTGSVLYRTGRLSAIRDGRLHEFLTQVRSNVDRVTDDEADAEPQTETAEASQEEPDVPVEFLSDDQRILEMLEENDGRMKQADIVKQIEWSKAKVSRVLSSMETDGQIVKIDIGRGNIITRPEDYPSGAESPFDR